MTLLEAIRDLDSLAEESTIYASEPWTSDSAAIVAPEPDTGGLPVEAQDLGLTYFLEIFIARDFLEDWAATFETEPSLYEKVAMVIHYAINDS
jgi:hypothetical protein